MREAVTVPAPSESAPRGAAPELADEQRAALVHLEERFGAYHCVLLDGVTGSGKTEVYLQAVGGVLARGESVLMLCPEIGLTPQLVTRVTARFATPTVALHSGLTDRSACRPGIRPRRVLPAS